MKTAAKRILIVGAGAVGGFYGSLLAKAGADVSVVCRSDYDAVKTQGFLINSADFGNYSFKPQHVVRRAEDYPLAADYVFLCTKIVAGFDRIEPIRAAVTPETSVVFIQNGVDVEQEMLDAFPDNDVISGIAFLCCNRTHPGILDHSAYGRLILGSLRNPAASRVCELCELFQRSGIACEQSGDIMTARWLKCLWNAPFNPLSVLTGGLDPSAILHADESFVRRIMADVDRIASALGHPLPANAIDYTIELTVKMPPYKSSMLLDYEHNRPLEIEAILGNAVRAARRANVSCPFLHALYSMIRLKLLADQVRNHRHEADEENHHHVPN